jgi:hypothetical protein
LLLHPSTPSSSHLPRRCSSRLVARKRRHTKEMRGPASRRLTRRHPLPPGYRSAPPYWRRWSEGSNGGSWVEVSAAVPPRRSAMTPLLRRTFRHLHPPRRRLFLVARSCDGGCPATNISGRCFLDWLTSSSSSARYSLSLVILIPSERDRFGCRVCDHLSATRPIFSPFQLSPSIICQFI